MQLNPDVDRPDFAELDAVEAHVDGLRHIAEAVTVAAAMDDEDDQPIYDLAPWIGRPSFDN